MSFGVSPDRIDSLNSAIFSLAILVTWSLENSLKSDRKSGIDKTLSMLGMFFKCFCMTYIVRKILILSCAIIYSCLQLYIGDMVGVCFGN